MSKSFKIGVWVIVAVVVIGGIIFFAGKRASAPSTYLPANGQNQANGNYQAPSAQNTSDVSLNQDLSAMDSQLSGLGADSASIDGGLNDQPLPVQ